MELQCWSNRVQIAFRTRRVLRTAQQPSVNACDMKWMPTWEQPYLCGVSIQSESTSHTNVVRGSKPPAIGSTWE